jgi:hypothetical protein
MMISHGVRHLLLPQPNSKLVQQAEQLGKWPKTSKKNVNIKRELFCHASQKK